MLAAISAWNVPTNVSVGKWWCRLSGPGIPQHPVVGSAWPAWVWCLQLVMHVRIYMYYICVCVAAISNGIACIPWLYDTALLYCFMTRGSVVRLALVRSCFVGQYKVALY